MNINYPVLAEPVKGTVIARAALVPKFRYEETAPGELTWRADPSIVEPNPDDTDFAATSRGYAAITALNANRSVPPELTKAFAKRLSSIATPMK